MHHVLSCERPFPGVSVPEFNGDRFRRSPYGKRVPKWMRGEPNTPAREKYPGQNRRYLIGANSEAGRKLRAELGV